MCLLCSQLEVRQKSNGFPIPQTINEQHLDKLKITMTNEKTQKVLKKSIPESQNIGNA
jgi:hypothetical protein